jgi:putative peptidoglycan lipid II flippase
VAAAGVVQFLWLAFHCRRAGVAVSVVRPRLGPKVKLLGRRILPVVFGASAYQINLLIGTILASLISDGAVSFLYYADRIVQLPLGVVGVAVGTALLPTLSRQIKGGQAEAADHSMNRGLEIALLLTLPAAVALALIPGPIVSVLFQRGAFTDADSAATAAALTAFASGLPAYVLIKVLAPGFFAREDTATPVRIAAWAMAANVVLNIILMQFFGHVGIALGASLSAWLNAGWLAWLLRRRGFLVIDACLRRRASMTVLASAVMGGAVALGAWALAEPLAGAFASRSLALAALIAGGLGVFAVAAVLTGATGLGDIKRFLRRDPA